LRVAFRGAGVLGSPDTQDGAEVPPLVGGGGPYARAPRTPRERATPEVAPSTAATAEAAAARGNKKRRGITPGDVVMVAVAMDDLA
jgi:hypothetical protein